jgi:16S rRNA (guanine527-N7)-methyltransferase
MPSSASDNRCCPETIRALCESAQLALDAEIFPPLAAYLTLLGKWNRVMNLVGPAAWEDILLTLVTDSVHLAPFVSALPLPVRPECWDLGAGAGLPGIPLRMLWKTGEYTLVEAREKRALFLRTFLASCPLDGVKVFQGRAEHFMPAHAPADLTVSRAFMPWEKFLALVNPFLISGGFSIFLTLAPLPSTLPKGWTAAGERLYSVNGNNRYFWALQKK